MKNIPLILSFILLEACASSKPPSSTHIDDGKILPIRFTHDAVYDTSVYNAGVPVVDTTLVPTRNPEAIYQVGPSYPEEMRRSGGQGVVWLKVLINPEGVPIHAQVFKSDNENFHRPAFRAVMQWRFKPAYYGTSPGYAWVAIPFKFALNK